MKIAVIGAGIIGVTTAYELARDGHEVTVFERRLTVAEESSFASAGLITPGYHAPWVVPGMRLKIIHHFFSTNAPVRFRLPLRGSDMAWMWSCLRAANVQTYASNRLRMQRLALYSRERLSAIGGDAKFEFDRSTGLMVMLRSARDHDRMQASLQALRDAGLPFQELKPEEARKIEPALSPDTDFHSAIHLADDEVGNCRQFALMLKNEAQSLGVQFAFSTTVEKIESSAGGMAVSIFGKTAPRRFDAAVVCAGVDSARLLRPLGLKLPLAPERTAQRHRG
jgi:D-amino-acid dehydrogenase